MPDPSAAIAPAPIEAPAERPEFPGVITSRRQKVITAEFQGEVQKLSVHQRKRVKAGDVIAKIDDTALRAELAQLIENERSARAEAGAYGAQAAQARAQMRTDNILVSRGVSPRNALRSSTANFRTNAGQAGAASARADSTKVKRKEIEALLTKAELASPIDGVITMITVKEGMVAQKGTPIARVFDDSDLVIRFAVPKEHKHAIAVGQRVELAIAGSDQPVWAIVEQIADEEPPITFAIVEANIDDSKLRPGEIQVASEGRVRIAEAQARAGANR